MNKCIIPALALAVAAGNVSASTVVAGELYINEVVHNPKGNDEEWEYIELYGCPNTSLTGLAVIVINDTNNDGEGEVDEAFVFPTSGSKYQTNCDGYFVIWNTGHTGSGDADDHAEDSEIWGHLPSSITQDLDWTMGELDAASTRYEASFRELETSTDDAGKISNDGSNSFLLIKDYTLTDIDKDSVVEMDAGDPDLDVTVIDEIAYNDDGDEFVFSEAAEFDYSPGFNPGFLMRVADITADVVDGTIDIHPGTGAGEDEPYRDAYSEWFSGEVDSNPSGSNDYFTIEADNYGAGLYTTGTPNTFTPQQNISGVRLTPGYANHTIVDTTPDSDDRKQISPSGSCTACSSLKGDINGDGFVDTFDIVRALELGADAEELLDILNRFNN